MDNRVRCLLAGNGRCVQRVTHMKKVKIAAQLAVLSVAFSATTVRADTLDSLGVLTQAQFLTLSENMGAATHYKALAPAEPLGPLGFDVALEVSSTDIDSTIFDLASGGGFELDTFLIPRLHVHKGLLFGLDIGASLTAIPDTDFKVFGAELRYAILEGSIATPALAVRATYSKVTGIDQVDFDTMGLELAVSKGFAILTPYAGVGYLRSNSKPNVDDLAEESFDQQKVFAGLSVNLGFTVGLEVDVTGDYTTYSVKGGLRF